MSIDHTIEAAIILAAGRGDRIIEGSSSVSSSLAATPKPLLPLSGTPGDPCFLDFHLRALALHGVKEIVIVGNSVTSRAPLRSIMQLAGKVTVRIVENPSEDLSTSGSGHSLWYALHAARKLLDGSRRVVFMDADIVYDTDIFTRLASADARRSATLVVPRRTANSDEVVAGANPDLDDVSASSDEVGVWAALHAKHNAIRHGKHLAGTPLVAGLEAVGEATGVVLLAPNDQARFAAIADWAIQHSTASTRSTHEDLTQLMMSLDLVDVVALEPTTMFMAVDSAADYEELTSTVWPALRARAGLSMPPMTVPPTTLPPTALPPISVPPMHSDDSDAFSSLPKTVSVAEPSK